MAHITGVGFARLSDSTAFFSLNGVKIKKTGYFEPPVSAKLNVLSSLLYSGLI